MRVLFVHPEDFPDRGPWSSQRWDLIVDLGRSSAASAASWEQKVRAPILRSDLFREGVEDLRQVRKLFSPGMGRMVDEEGIDWWALISLLLVPEAETVLVFQRMLSQLDAATELWTTRPGWPASAAGQLLRPPLRSFQQQPAVRLAARVGHYAALLRRFTARQIKEIFLDKYDSDYRWRARLASRTAPLTESSILLPSAYGNVSRMAAAYARLLPQQSFLLVATRQSGRLSSPSPNIHTRDLATYVEINPLAREIAAIFESWTRWKADLVAIPELAILLKAGVFDAFPHHIRHGLRVRDTWRVVLEREPVRGVLCGDDSNFYTRLPVMLAAKRGIATVDFHHGAMDGRYLLKNLPCDVYLAKNEMERDYLLRVCGLSPEKVVLGAPAPAPADSSERATTEPSSAVFFSEPYEIAGLRAGEVYREILPPLCRVARQCSRRVVVKLHPFESRSQRIRLIRELLSEEDFREITVLDGPLSQQLLSDTWFGVTLESTTVVDCFLRGITCFVCGWLKFSSFGYAEQYQRFAIAPILHDAKELEEIPSRLAGLGDLPSREILPRTADPEMLRQWLGIKSCAGVVDGRIS